MFKKIPNVSCSQENKTKQNPSAPNMFPIHFFLSAILSFPTPSSLISPLKIIVYFYLCVYTSSWTPFACSYRRSQKRALEPLEQELHIVVSHL